MPTTQSLSPLMTIVVDNHLAAALQHEEAALSHRLAAALYTDGNYPQANEHACHALNYGQQAQEFCARATG